MIRPRHLLSCAAVALALAMCPVSRAQRANAQSLPNVIHGPSAPDAEFDAASSIHILPGGAVLEISGTFNTTMPLSFNTVLAQAPHVRTIRFESPGGNVQSALAVAEIVRTRGLDTYVGRLCASACTLAFLGGQHRYLSPIARLGFHQASAPGVAPERLDPMLRAAYVRSNVPTGFIDHVLHTAPGAIWFPTRDELRAAGFMTGTQPDTIAVTDDPVSAVWGESMKLMRWASDPTIVLLGQSLSALLGQLQANGGDACWDFMHEVPTDLNAMVRHETLDTMTTALKLVRDDVSHGPAVGIDSAGRVRILTTLVASLRSAIQNEALDALRPGGAHETYCRSMRVLVDTALQLPAAYRGSTLRALLSDS